MTDFEPANQDINFFRLRREKHKNVTKGINLGKAGGLRLLLDAEVCFLLLLIGTVRTERLRLERLIKNGTFHLQRYDYMYSRLGEGEGFKVGIIPYRDIPLMFLHDVEVKPGSATSIVVHPQITRTSEAARERWQLTAN